MKRVTMRDIARVAEVSVMTVSYALRGHPCIPPETTRRIRQCAEELGYQCHPLVSAFISSIRHGRTPKAPPTIALVSMYKERAPRDSFRDLHHQGAAARCREAGFQLELFEAGQTGLSGKRLTEVLRYNNFAGLLLAPMPVTGMSLDIDWKYFPVVALGDTLNQPGIDRVGIDHIKGILLAFRKLTHLGYRKIALATFRGSSTRIRDRYIAAAAIWNQSHNASRSPHPVLLAPDTNFTAECFSLWLRKNRPDALIDAGQQRFGKLLKEAGITYPQQIAYARSHWTADRSDLAGIDPCPFEVGAAGIDLLISKIYANERGILSRERSLLIEPTWHDGSSAPPIGKRQSKRDGTSSPKDLN